MRSVNLLGYNNSFFCAFPWPGFPWFEILDVNPEDYYVNSSGYSIWLMVVKSDENVARPEKLIVRWLGSFESKCRLYWAVNYLREAQEEGVVEIYALSKNKKTVWPDVDLEELKFINKRMKMSENEE